MLEYHVSEVFMMKPFPLSALVKIMPNSNPSLHADVFVDGPLFCWQTDLCPFGSFRLGLFTSRPAVDTPTVLFFLSVHFFLFIYLSCSCMGHVAYSSSSHHPRFAFTQKSCLSASPVTHYIRQWSFLVNMLSPLIIIACDTRRCYRATLCVSAVL